MQDKRKIELCKYRIGNAADSLKVAHDCLEKEYYRDAINRSYYAVFYAVKSVLALEGKDFKRHKDVIAYFNHTYVASGIISKEIGRKIGRLQQKREKSDYDDFYLTSKEDTKEQIVNADEIIATITEYLKQEGVLG